MTEQFRPRMVVSDVDGTLITSQERITPRLCDAITAFVGQGGYFALATGRPPRWIFYVLEQLPVRPICICANGAVIYDSDADRILKVHNLESEVLRTVVTAARASLEDLGGVECAVERAGKSAFEDTRELFTTTPDFTHSWDSNEHGITDEATLLARPAMKLLLRNDKLTATQMFERVRPVIPESMAHVTFSMNDGLLEVMAPGINKATGVADVAEIVGVGKEDIAAFGDMPNDLEMISWVGHGVAVANARDSVKSVADEITTTNDDFGVARVMERWI